MDKFVKVFAVVAVAATVAGCGKYATKAELAEVNGRAVTAGEQATAANKLASQAIEKAKLAQATADAAVQCCTDQKNRLDGLFEKAMRK